MRGLEWGHLPWDFVIVGGCLDHCCLGLGCLHGECTFLNIVGVLDQTCAALDVALRHSYCIVHVCGHTTAVTCTLLSYHQCRKSFFLSFFLSFLTFLS